MEKYSKFQRSSWSSRAKEFNKAGGGITVTSILPLAFSWPTLIKAVSAVLFLKNV